MTDISKIIERLQKNDSTLTEVDLLGKKPRKDQLLELFEALKTNTTLKHLNIGYCEIDDKLVEALCPALRENNTLTSLDLDGNKITDKGVEALCEALRKNKAITSLDLNENKIGDDGAGALADMLMDNSTLTVLNLNDNQIGDFGADGLRLPNLLPDGTIASLDMGNNNITNIGKKFLEEICKSGSKNLVDIVPNTITLEQYCKANKEFAAGLIEKMLEHPDALTAEDRKEIGERLPAIRLTAKHEREMSDQEIDAMLVSAKIPLGKRSEAVLKEPRGSRSRGGED